MKNLTHLLVLLVAVLLSDFFIALLSSFSAVPLLAFFDSESSPSQITSVTVEAKQTI